MVLVNGIKGIGTGFSTDILPYNPSVIINYLLDKIDDQDVSSHKFIPYWNGFKGKIYEDSENNKYMVKGIYSRVSKDTIHITELPVGYWTDDFKVLLETLMDNVDKNGKKIKPIVKEYDDMSKSTNVDIKIKFVPGVLDELLSNENNNINNLEKVLKLVTTYSTNNMHLFNHEEKLKKYTSVIDIINDYYHVRIHGYAKRRLHIIEILKNELVLLSNKKRYIEELLEGTLDLRKKKKDEIISILKKKKYDMLENDEYKYLLKMPMDSVSLENIDKIVKDWKNKKDELDYYMKITEKELWKKELLLLKDEYVKYIVRRESIL
tara:strand:- start:852 stop:1814 length:963 start_codon:yes stop_codon:yes gene_type:complete